MNHTDLFALVVGTLTHFALGFWVRHALQKAVFETSPPDAGTPGG